ncbi:MAG TPA: chromosome segregation protein SMC [Saprospiraceae bacterium]|nr:chromosome segregation protein SMC [Saprospiraceae bacterium]
MRLKSLTIKGFKSFANETIIHFNEDVIGVVGPNGSGKSNVVDAIRWVLGEQKNKELRLEQMSDVIFNGTKKRKEANAATVELLFENDRGILATEYQHVSLSRTLYRSGESEYRLNNIVCRLKDIKSLLVDTGIGSNSYAIIALGMVDDILEDKEDARRRMFEQAAGISKYKSRKKETLQKLQSTTIDLDRVEDLVFEIEGNMKTLEKQAKRTKKYFELKEEYKELAINNAIRSIQSLKERYKEINQQIAEKQDAYAKVQVSIQEHEAKLQYEKKQILDKEITLNAKQKELGQIVGNIRSLESEKSLTEQSRSFKVQNIKNLEKLIADLGVQKIQLDQDIVVIEEKDALEVAKATELQSQLSEAQAVLNQVRADYQSIKRDHDQRTLAITTIKNQIFDLEKASAIASNNINNLQAESDRLESLQKTSASDQIEAENKLKEIKAKVASAQERLDQLNTREEEKKSRISQLEVERDAIQDKINATNRQIDSKQNEHDLLKSMIESYEGFPESIKFLAAKWRKDVPILSDILDVEEAYKTVIEQYLENYLNHFIVNDLQDAAVAIKILSGSQKGKANFFLLDKVKLGPQLNDLPGAKKATSVVKVDERFRKLIDSLLSNAFIIDRSIDDFQYDESYENAVLLSSNGSFMQSGAIVSGGSVGLFEGKKIGRKKNLEKLEDLLKKLQLDRGSLVDQIEKTKAEWRGLKSEDLGQELQRLNKEHQSLQQEQVKVTVQFENIDKISKERLQQIANNAVKIKAFQDDAKQKHEAITLKKTELETLEGKSDATSSLDATSEKLGSVTEKYNEINIQFIRQQNLVQNIQKDLDYKRTRLKDINQRNKVETNRLAKEKEEYLDGNGKLVVIENDLAKLYKEKSGYQGNLSEAEQAYFKSREVVSDIEEKVKLYTRNSNTLQVDINVLKDKFTEVKYEISAVGDRLNIEFGVPVNDIINRTPDETIPLEEVLERADALKSKIQNYGEINPLALEAYEEIKVRYDLIIQQRADIFAAKESLLQTIKEIEETATKQFMESFEKIRENFIHVFRSLFTEDDTCDLILLEPEDPLESHIEIIAKPKGKKPKSLSQLSGGEKTLTATALLFALYLLKPAPFCIFDEVDAPLDDANIEKFNRIIKKFSGQSQFVIVTHNKATMAAVDVLYGVYMQEQGVSGVTPVDFRSYENETVFQTLN